MIAHATRTTPTANQRLGNAAGFINTPAICIGLRERASGSECGRTTPLLLRVLLAPDGLKLTVAGWRSDRAGQAGTCPRSPKPRRSLECSPLPLFAARGLAQSKSWPHLIPASRSL